MNKRKKLDEWIMNNGACEFDLKKRDIWLFDGGLFSIEKEVKLRPRSRFKRTKDGLELVHIKGKKVKVEYYKAVFWFEELDETINYLKRMKKVLNKLGYKTNFKKSKSK